MKNNTFVPGSQKEMLDYLDGSAEQLDQQRLAGLQEEKNYQIIKDEVLQREQKRLEEKHGNSHPVVQEAENRLAYNKQMFRGLDKEIEKASITTTPMPNTSWRVHGRVFGSDSSPMKGVTVYLADQNKRWVEATGNSCTNELGYYSITLDEKLIQKLDPKQPLYLAVSDKNKSVLYFSSSPIFVVKGFVDLQDIYIEGNECITPPDNNTRKPQLPPDAWVVKGKVTDENNRGLGGLTVSLYDKDLLFDDALGTTHTNDTGAFELVYRTDAFDFIFDKNPDLYLKVLDSKGKKLYTSDKMVRPEAGRVEEFNIKIETRKKE